MASINLQNVQIKNGSTWYKMCPFPVGFVYCSTNNTSPATTYGGTWTALTNGRYLRATGAWGSGGSNYISVDQMPSHTHKFNRYSWARPYGTTNWDISTGYPPATGDGGATDAASWYSVANTGGSKAFYPTYQNVYCWYRTA